MKKLPFILLSLLVFSTACDKKTQTPDAAPKEAVETATDTVEQKAEEAKEEVAEQKEEDAAPSKVADIHPDKATLTAPDKFKVLVKTTKGDFTIDVDKSLSPTGADRFYNLVKLGFYNDVAFFRVIDGFMAQFGMSGDPKITAAWQEATINDDPVKGSNTRGQVSFAKTGAPNSRTTQLFINYRDNSNLDNMGFAPFGTVSEEGMKVVDSLYKDYGEGAPMGKGPSQDLIRQEGNTYLKRDFPQLDYVKEMTVEE